jgi:acyl-CoA thioesterase-2
MSAIKKLNDLLNLNTINSETFTVSAKETGWRRIFGGLIVAQAIIAAYRTVEEKNLHSLHCYFLRAGDPDIPIIYKVAKLRDGNSFVQRNIYAYQNKHLIFHMIASFHKVEEGLNHQDTMPHTKDPSVLVNEIELLEKAFKNRPENIRDTRNRLRPIEFRPVNPRNMICPEKEKPEQLVWFRTSNKINTSIPLNQALLAYASDYTILDTALMPHALSIFQKDLQIASLDHSIWFHRPFDVNEWLLYSQRSHSSYGNRGFASGHIFSQTGNLIATIAQEGMIRLPPNN